MAHGSQKLFGLFGGPGVSATLKTFEEKMGIPPILTILAMIAEFGGGLGVLLGCVTRLSASGITSVMVVAIYKVHLANGFFLNLSLPPGARAWYRVQHRPARHGPIPRMSPAAASGPWTGCSGGGEDFSIALLTPKM